MTIPRLIVAVATLVTVAVVFAAFQTPERTNDRGCCVHPSKVASFYTDVQVTAGQPVLVTLSSAIPSAGGGSSSPTST